MNIDKAIEILDYSSKYATYHFSQDEKDAVKLSIEALKRIKGYRDHTVSIDMKPLPGETED